MSELLGPKYHYFRGQSSKKACGFCHSNKHKGYLSVKNMKQHKCLQKQCPMFEKYPDHPYWAQKAAIKAKKKARKENRHENPL